LDDELTLVLKALYHPSRRKILDILKISPMTTGEISEQFEESRYAVMKHLAVLEKAGLLLIRREGRSRVNYLNVIPLQQLFGRWVSKYEEPTAASLVNLKTKLESEERK
jgi:DNA-binding transcriptional ArsR family regulator